MKPSRNEHTGDFMLTGAASEKYRAGWDLVFGKKKEEVKPEEDKEEQDEI